MTDQTLHSPARRLQEFLSDLTNRCVGSPISVRKTENGWKFSIGETIKLGDFLLWRLIGYERIEVSGEDHGHQFGLPAPIDAENRFNALVGEARVANVSVDSTTGDLMLVLDNDLTLQVLVTSCGYECWTVHDGDDFLGAGISGGVV